MTSPLINSGTSGSPSGAMGVRFLTGSCVGGACRNQTSSFLLASIHSQVEENHIAARAGLSCVT